MKRRRVDRRDPARRARWLAHAPLVIYPLSFGLTIATYGLGWSNLYPPLGAEILGFLAFSSLLFLAVLGASRITWRSTRTTVPTTISSWTTKRATWTTWLIYVGLALECLHAGGVPLMLIFSDSNYDYRNFGIPTFHVVFLGIYTFLCIHFFDLYLKSRRRQYLHAAVALAAINLLIVNRGALVQVILSCALLFAAHYNLRWKFVMRLIIFALLFVVVFGYLGDARMIAMGIPPEVTILVIGEASQEYPSAWLGTGPFWFYLYVSSPLANWQLNVMRASANHADFITLAALELLPDFLGKHLVNEETFRLSPHLITEALTASTAYGRAFFLDGWLGSWAVFLLLMLYYFAARRLFRASEYFESAMAIFGAGVALLIFFNMVSFIGWIGPLVIGAVLHTRSTRHRRRAGDRSTLAQVVSDPQLGDVRLDPEQPG